VQAASSLKNSLAQINQLLVRVAKQESV